MHPFQGYVASTESKAPLAWNLEIKEYKYVNTVIMLQLHLWTLTLICQISVLLKSRFLITEFMHLDFVKIDVCHYEIWNV